MNALHLEGVHKTEYVWGFCGLKQIGPRTFGCIAFTKELTKQGLKIFSIKKYQSGKKPEKFLDKPGDYLYFYTNFDKLLWPFAVLSKSDIGNPNRKRGSIE